MWYFGVTAAGLLFLLGTYQSIQVSAANLKKQSFGDETLFSIGHEIFFHPDRIVGGSEAFEGEFPGLIDLRFRTPNGKSYHACGASILSSEWVITAAHCSQNKASKYKLVAGAYNLEEPTGQEQRVNVTKVIVHPKYNARTVANDIALMKVSPPFIIDGKSVTTVQLPPADFKPTAEALVVGWGALASGGSSPDILQKVSVPFVEHDTCIKAYKNVNDIVPSMLCYGEKGKDSCQGDSGGPLFCSTEAKPKDGDDTFVDVNGYCLCGLVSWGYGCAEADYPGVYTNVYIFRDWIAETIKANS